MQSYNYGKKTDKEIQDECRNIFIREYIRQDNGNTITIKTVDGFQVIFEEKRFEHAFSRERESGLREFDYSRARKILWIKKVIKEKCDGLTVLSKDITKKGIQQRIYYLPNNEYVVVLDWIPNAQPPCLKFNTAYLTTMAWKRAELKSIFGIK